MLGRQTILIGRDFCRLGFHDFKLADQGSLMPESRVCMNENEIAR